MGATDVPESKVWTYDDLPTVRDDGRRFEIFDGRLIVSLSPPWDHERIAKRLFLALHRALELTDRAAVYFGVDVILSPTKVLVPDLVAVRLDRMSIFSKRGVEAAPDLVVEILTPSNAKHDVVRKRRCYAQSRIREYWIVDPSTETIEVLELIDGGLSYRTHGLFTSGTPGERASSPLFGTEVSVNAVFGYHDAADVDA